MESMKSYRVGRDVYLSVTDLRARIALVATHIGICMDNGTIGREEAKGALTVLVSIKDGLDAL